MVEGFPLMAMDNMGNDELKISRWWGFKVADWKVAAFHVAPGLRIQEEEILRDLGPP